MPQYIEIRNKAGKLISVIEYEGKIRKICSIGGQHMDILEQSLNKQVEDEFKAVLEYDDLIEKMGKERETIKDVDKHVHTLRDIQKQQAVHVLELTNMVMEMGFKEPSVIHQLEEFFKIKEY